MLTVADDRFAVTAPFVLSSATAQDQAQLVLASLPGQGFIAVWCNNTFFPSSTVVAQLFDLNGRKLGAEFTVATGGAGEPAVTALQDGRLVITWTVEAPYPQSFDVHGQIFDPSGNRIGSEFIANTQLNGFQDGSSVAALSNGGFVVVWKQPEDTTYDNFHAQVFAADGSKVGGEFIATDGLAGDKYHFSVVGLSGGGFVIGWDESAGEVADQYGNLSAGERAQVFDNSGNKVGAAFAVNTIVPGSQAGLTLAALPTGGFVAAWADDGNRYHPDFYPQDIGVWTQFFDAHGGKVGSPILASSLGGAGQISPSIAVSASSLMVTWKDSNATSDSPAGHLRSQALDFSGNKLGAEFSVNPGLDARVTYDSDIALSNGAYVIGWDNNAGPQYNNDDVVARMLFPVVHGTEGDDVFTGTAGRDFYIGHGGNDTIHGGAEDDSLSGAAGNDYLDGGAGADTMEGGTGNDIYIVDSLSDVVIEQPGEGTDEVRTTLATYVLPANVENLTGTSAIGQTLTGNGLDNVITGNSGNDVIDGGTGADHMTGGLGDDTYYVGNIGDVVTENAGEGTDEVRTTLASYVLAANVENLTGLSTSGQTLTGNDLDNVITGNSGNDVIDGGAAGSDTINAQGGDDIIYVHGTGADTVDAGTGTDTLVVNFSQATQAVFDARDPSANGVSGGWDGIFYNSTDGGNVFYKSVERFDITTGSGDDNILTADGNDQIHTGAGNDTISSGGGNDILDGGTGADAMTGGAGNDIYYVDNAGDVVTENAGEGTDEVRTTLSTYVLPANVENLTGTAATAQDLRGNVLDNVITGGGGADFFRLQDGGNDTVSGNGGNDVFYFGAAFTSADKVDGGPGADQIALQGDYATAPLVLGTQVVGIESLYLMAGSDTRLGDNAGNLYSYNITTVDQNIAAGQQLTIDGSPLRAGENLTVNGSAETDGSLWIYAGGGTDALTGGHGNDVFLFGQGKLGASDHVDGGPGTDQLALRGNYTITFGATQITSIESLYLISAHDTRVIGTGTDFTYNLTMDDANLAAGQRMTVDGSFLRSTEAYTFNGSAELDGTFRIFGGAGDDHIIGGHGNDILVGALGGDVLTGGAGADIFQYRSAAETTNANPDHITDFLSGTDKIDLHLIDADTNVAGDQAFTFIGATAFDGHAGELRVSDSGLGYYNVEGDVNGDGIADFTIHVTLDGASTPIVATDFLA